MRTVCRFGFARSRQGGAHFPNVRGLLKYIQYRDNRTDHIPNAGGPDRWVDGGLGQSYPHILKRLDRLSRGNPRAYCHFVVVSPDPRAIAAAAEVQGDPQARFVRAVQDTVQEWDDWRQKHDAHAQAGPIEYSFVVHRPERNYGEQMHAHLVIAAATEHASSGDLTPLGNFQAEIQAFKEINGRQLDIAYELDRERDEPEPDVQDVQEALEVQNVQDLERDIPFFEEEQIAEAESGEANA
jgi:hypothetical protein